jgi:hypothetical protein
MWHFPCSFQATEVNVDTRTVTDLHRRTTRNETIPRWNRAARATLGMITFGLILLFAVGAATMIALSNPAELSSPGLGPMHYVLFVATFAQFLLMMFYLSFAAQNPRTDVRGLWMLGIIALPFAIMPVYWWTHIWNAPYVADPDHDYNVPGGEMTAQAD